MLHPAAEGTAWRLPDEDKMLCCLKMKTFSFIFNEHVLHVLCLWSMQWGCDGFFPARTEFLLWMLPDGGLWAAWPIDWRPQKLRPEAAARSYSSCRRPALNFKGKNVKLIRLTSGTNIFPTCLIENNLLMKWSCFLSLKCLQHWIMGHIFSAGLTHSK